ncbi:replication initiation protein [Azohydromonas lata]|uniref:replication initiation protein n=1 Tax=Azohydromonas lata TaxID=45677 RepID=UPI000833FAC7|nr:replication initiation protein [Azohydromonas lata]
MAKKLTSLKKDAPAGMLNKPVAALAIVPLNKSLTVTARKAYNVMLHIAQRQGAQGADGSTGFSAPLNAILRGFGAGSNVAVDAKRYIEQMMSTKIEWRPLSRGEQWSLLPADAAAASFAEGGAADTRDELRMFNMLSEVRLYKKNGENWVTWFYPPTIQQQMLGPNRWARLELETIAQLGTYTAVALYEICARYRDNPGGVTARQHWSWWVAVLKGSELARQREWRKFKNEFVSPAIRDINEISDLEIELLEYKEGRAVAEVQFAVRRKQAPEVAAARAEQQPADVTQVARALALGLRESDVDAFMERYGEAAVARALDAMQRYAGAGASKPIVNKAAYLKTILAGLENEAHPTVAQPGTPAPAPAAAAPGPMAAAPRPAAAVREAGLQNPATAAQQAQSRALAQARAVFEALPEAEQAAWMERLRAHVVAAGTATPTLMRRLDARQWQSPLVMASMVRFYMEQNGLG